MRANFDAFSAALNNLANRRVQRRGQDLQADQADLQAGVQLSGQGMNAAGDILQSNTQQAMQGNQLDAARQTLLANINASQEEAALGRQAALDKQITEGRQNLAEGAQRGEFGLKQQEMGDDASMQRTRQQGRDHITSTAINSKGMVDASHERNLFGRDKTQQEIESEERIAVMKAEASLRAHVQAAMEKALDTWVRATAIPPSYNGKFDAATERVKKMAEDRVTAIREKKAKGVNNPGGTGAGTPAPRRQPPGTKVRGGTVGPDGYTIVED
jgi:hypothetical protein